MRPSQLPRSDCCNIHIPVPCHIHICLCVAHISLGCVLRGLHRKSASLVHTCSRYHIPAKLPASNAHSPMPMPMLTLPTDGSQIMLMLRQLLIAPKLISEISCSRGGRSPPAQLAHDHNHAYTPSLRATHLRSCVSALALHYTCVTTAHDEDAHILLVLGELECGVVVLVAQVLLDTALDEEICHFLETLGGCPMQRGKVV